MSAIFDLSTAVKARRAEMGLTQTRLALLSNLSRATVNQVESATIKDLSLTRAARLLAVLGLLLKVSVPQAANCRIEASRTPALELAARSASVSYRNPLSAKVLRNALTGGDVPGAFKPHLRTFVEEASPALLASVVEQLHAEAGIARADLWQTLRRWARELQSSRELWR